jgi:acyl transferase domain-containing protein
MMSVNLKEDQVSDYLQSKGLSHFSSSIHVACVNSPNNVTLSGHPEGISALHKCFIDDGIFAKILATGVAYHSPAMLPIASEYRSFIESLEPGDLESPEATSMISSVNGEIVSSLSFASYWVDNLVCPVRFLDALDTLVRQKSLAGLGSSLRLDLVEVGPHDTLRYPVLETMKNRGLSTAIRYFSALKRATPPHQAFLECVGNLFSHGHSVSVWGANNDDTTPKQVALLPDCPAYPFDHTNRYWAEPRLSREYRTREITEDGILGPRFYDHSHELRWRTFLNTKDMPWVEDHVVSERKEKSHVVPRC